MFFSQQVCETGRARVAQAAVSDGCDSVRFSAGAASERLEGDRIREGLGRLILWPIGSLPGSRTRSLVVGIGDEVATCM